MPRTWTIVAATSLGFALSAPAQDFPQMPNVNMNINVRDSQMQQGHEKKTETIENTAEGYKVTYETASDDYTRIKVLSPEGMTAEVWEGTGYIAGDTIPMSAVVKSNEFFRIVVKDSNGSQVWEKKIESKNGMVANLWVRPGARTVAATAVVQTASPVPSGGVAMSEGDFQALKQAIQAESFKEKRIGVLETAAGSSWFRVDQVGQLVDLMTFRDEKVKTVELTNAHIVDRQNGFKLIGHFTFGPDKEKVKQLLK